MHTDTCVVVPVFNKEDAVGQVVKELSRHFANVICVDDGSTDNSLKAIKATSATMVKHANNQGQGAALQTGIEAALKNPAIKYIVTFDADGQHRVADAKRLVGYIKDHPSVDIVLGSRFLGEAKGISPIRLGFLRLAVIFSNFTTGLKLTDTHNGLRVFNRSFATQLKLRAARMAHASEIIFKIARGEWAYKELPVTILYTDYSKSKGQSMLGAFVVVRDLWAQRSADR